MPPQILLLVDTLGPIPDGLIKELILLNFDNPLPVTQKLLGWLNALPYRSFIVAAEATAIECLD